MLKTKNSVKVLPAILTAGLSVFLGCQTGQSKSVQPKQSDFEAPPKAQIHPEEFTKFGNKRVDNYYWLKDKNNPEVIDYLKAENAYTDTVMASTKDLQKTLYDEMIARIKEDDESYPVFRNGYYYYSRVEKGKQYRVYCRKKGSLEAEEEIFFDVNKMAEGKNAFIFSRYSVSPDNTKAIYFYNETGSFAEFTMKIRDLTTGKDLPFTVEGAASATWAADNKTVFYSTIDDSLRSSKIYRNTIEGGKAEFIYEEKDVRFSAYVSGEKTRRFISIYSTSSTTSEERLIPADTPRAAFTVFKPRVQDIDYSVIPHKDCFFIQYKDKENLNGKLYKAPLTGFENTANWQEIVPHNPDVRIEGIDIFKDFLVLELRKNGLIEIKILSIADGSEKNIAFPEPVYTASLSGNPEYDAETIRYTYSSLNRPQTLYEYTIGTGKTEKLKEQEIPSGFNPDNYTVERLWAQAPDGVKVPMAVVYKKGLKKNSSAPALLYSYGSYGISSDVYFDSTVYSLIDRGFVYAVAQIRGGSDLGEQWYEDGKLLKKKNTFTDFIACAEHLINRKYTASDKLAIMGGSAGGLLMGAVTNMRPDLFHTVVAQVPFVDVVTTMLDDTLPLTTGEYEEWGNPNEEEYYKYMLSYSPYDNIEAKNYPNILVTGGINDSQVLFHEPAKYTAKLRELKTDNNILILHMNMESGHGGATGRYSRFADIAFDYAFILSML
ncbi:S9 family peptidase [Treponema pedis]|uniref:S9 family peptidase n=1 Tax=Treponema pedis TaxID=409322 RepID=A0A7S6WPE4_9SPIR|nr:S9 family peptidase [Treponema pedis]QOW60880.1 S9 family peptidase [Treponema pedis]